MPIHIQASFTVDATFDKAWRIIGDFGTEEAWVGALAKTTRNTRTVDVGTVRSCELAKPAMGMSHIRERVVAFSEGHLGYEVIAPPWPFRRMTNTWLLEPHGEQCQVTIDGQLDLRRGWRWMRPLVAPTMQRFAREAVDEFRHYVEGPAPEHGG